MPKSAAAEHNGAIARALRFLRAAKSVDESSLSDLIEADQVGIDLAGGSGSHEVPGRRELGMDGKPRRMSGAGADGDERTSGFEPQIPGGGADMATQLAALMGEMNKSNRLMAGLLKALMSAADDDEEDPDEEDPDEPKNNERGAAETEKALRRLARAKSTTPKEMFRALGLGNGPRSGVTITPPVFKSRGVGVVTPELVQTRIETASETGAHNVMIAKAESLLGRFVRARAGTYDVSAFARELELADSEVQQLFEPPTV